MKMWLCLPKVCICTKRRDPLQFFSWLTLFYWWSFWWRMEINEGIVSTVRGGHLSPKGGFLMFTVMMIIGVKDVDQRERVLMMVGVWFYLRLYWWIPYLSSDPCYLTWLTFNSALTLALTLFFVKPWPSIRTYQFSMNLFILNNNVQYNCVHRRLILWKKMHIINRIICYENAIVLPIVGHSFHLRQHIPHFQHLPSHLLLRQFFQFL